MLCPSQMTSFITSPPPFGPLISDKSLYQSWAERSVIYGSLLKPARSHRLASSGDAARRTEGLTLHDLTVGPDVPMTVSRLKCNRWALASRSLPAQRCWGTLRDAPTHAHEPRRAPDGLLLPENEIPFCPPTDQNVLRFACVNECSPRCLPSECSTILSSHSFRPMQD